MQDCGLCRIDGLFPDMAASTPLATFSDSAHWECRNECHASDACSLAVTDTASGACDLYSMSLTSDTRLYYVDSAVLYVRGGCPDLCNSTRVPETRRMRGADSLYDWSGQYGESGESGEYGQ
jgi:hypothetical protein